MNLKDHTGTWRPINEPERLLTWRTMDLEDHGAEEPWRNLKDHQLEGPWTSRTLKEPGGPSTWRTMDLKNLEGTWRTINLKDQGESWRATINLKVHNEPDGPQWIWRTLKEPQKPLRMSVKESERNASLIAPLPLSCLYIKKDPVKDLASFVRSSLFLHVFWRVMDAHS